MLKRLLVAALIVALPGCIYWQRTPLTGLDHVSGWADQIRAAAAEAYPYAQMSTNAYNFDPIRFDLGPDFENPVNESNNEIGFAYSIFERRERGRLAEVIIAFRGTEFWTREDWVHGNILARQNAEGLALYESIRRATPESADVTVTGHSLGGGIAIYVSLHRPAVKAYVFNSSPRFRLRGPAQSNRRLSIVEYGEILKAGRVFGREADQTYVSINCVRGPGTLSQHSIRPLAECLTRIAAYAEPDARDSLRRNRLRPPVGVSLN